MENPDKKYAKMEQPEQGTMHLNSMNHKVAERIEWVYWAHQPEIITLLLHDIYLWLVFSPKASMLPITEQGLDSSDRLRVLVDKNIDDICNVVRKLGHKNTDGMPDRSWLKKI